MTHPRNQREWMREVERQLARNGGAIASTGYTMTDVVNGVIEDTTGRIPTAPIELVTQTSLYLNTRGVWRGRFTMDFPDVTVATNATPLAIGTYELQGRQSGTLYKKASESAPSTVVGPRALAVAHPPNVKIGGAARVAPRKASATARGQYPTLRADDAGVDWQTMAWSSASSLRVDDLEPGSLWVFRARAVSTAGRAGEWSAEVSVQILHDNQPPQQLTRPVATVSRGTITVTWDGQAVTGQLPADFLYAELAQGTDANPTEIVARFHSEGGFTVISNIPYYDPQFFRIRAVDESGNVGPWSAQEVAYVEPLVDEDVILSTIDAAQTLLINVDASVSILSDTILTRHLVITEDMTVALLAAHKIVAGDIAANAVTTDKLDAGAVTASKLTSTLVLTSKIVAGPEAGTHAEFDATGFHQFILDPISGVPRELGRIGVAASGDYLTVTRADNSVAASITTDGAGAFEDLSTRNTLYYRGRELSDILWEMPRGILYKSELIENVSGITSEYGLMEAEMLTDGTDRQVRMDAGCLFYPQSPPAEVYFRLRYTVDGSAPTISSPMIIEIPSGYNWDDKFTHKTFTYSVRPTQLTSLLNQPGRRLRILLTVFTASAGTCLNPRSGFYSYLYLTDEGPGIKYSPSHNKGGGVITFGGAPPPPAQVPSVQNYYREWGCIANRNYDGANNYYSFNDSQAFQGLSPAGYGNLKSISVFDSMTSVLSGATINQVRVFYSFNHWYYNAGGTARIGVHGHTSIPSTFTSVGPLSTISGGWPAPHGRWVDLSSSHWDGFRTGAYRGVYLLGDGTYNTYGYSNLPVIGIYYTK